MAENDRIKIAGYAKRIFFNDNIEYRNFSPDLVGFQLTSEGGTTLFTNANFSIDVNLDPKPNVVFTQGAKSKLFCLDDIVIDPTEKTIQKNIKTKLNLDLTNPLSYIWYGSAKELIRSSLLEIQEYWPAAIYVDNKVGSVTGNNITNYVYDISTDESTFTVNSRFFVNPYNIKYTLDSQYVPSEDTSNKLRNFTVNHTSYVIEHNGISKPILSITPAAQKTNSEMEIVVRGNPFPELTGIYIPTLSFLFTNVDASIPYFIKPNEIKIEGFFTSLNNFQTNILSRETNPPYNSIIISTEATDDGVILTSKETLLFPLLEDGYNLNFFDSFYLTYLDKLNTIGENLDDSRTDIIIRKYTTEAINSFDTIPRGDGNDLVLNGEKATKLLRIYGVSFDDVKKYINGIKFAHVVTYNKRDNVPDALVKDLSHMLGLDPITFVTSNTFSKLLLPSNGAGEFSGTSVNYTQQQIDIELYRRLILNIAWLWKSKGTRKAVEFLFRFIGAPEALVNFDEYIVMVDKPLDMDEIKKLLYLYTGEVSDNDLKNIPYDDNGYPLPPIDGEIVVTDFIDPATGNFVQGGLTDMYFQKAGGWYRETYGGPGLTVLRGNNPHIGQYDGGNEYLHYFSRCYIPNFNSDPTVIVTADTITKNYFINYNYGIFNGIPTGSTEFYTTQLTYNSLTNGYQPIDECVDINYSIIETPIPNDGKTTFQQQFEQAEQEYLDFQSQIQENSYLQYSPEWQVIKNNYELAQNNCLLEVSTENCDINKTLEICINELEVDILPFNCNSLSAVTGCTPFMYYVNDEGDKVTFDEFGGRQGCCETFDDGQYDYVTYVNESGVRAEYCSAVAPCIGEFDSILPGSNIIVWNITNNNLPPNTYQLYSQDGKEICVEFIGDESIFINSDSNPLGLSPGDYINYYNGQIWLMDPKLLSKLFFTTVPCGTTTIISSPECCAYWGYDYQVVSDSNGDEYIVCVTKKDQGLSTLIENQTSTIIDGQNTIIPILNTNVNTTYNEYQNPVGDIVPYYTTNMFKDCFEESVTLLGPDPNSNSLFITPNALFSSSTLNNPHEWEVNAIDQYGRVSFTPKDPFYDFILDWNSIGQPSVLYQQIAELYGYSFGQFIFNCDGILIPYYNPTILKGIEIFSGDFSPPPSIITAAVDDTRIGCDDINNVSVTFASEKWQGFKLPELEDCSCTIDFSFDYMLKYNVENLMECVQKDPCNPSIFNEVSLNNIDCRNFIVFTSNEEDPNDPSSLVNNFTKEENITRLPINQTPQQEGGSSTLSPKPDYEIWQSNSCIIEPPLECCEAIGGNVVSVNEWASTNQTWVNFINTQYQSIKDGELIKPIPIELSDYITGLETNIEEINSIINGCYNIILTPISDCRIDYDEYIQTENICSLDVPLECGLWTNTLTQYRELIKSVGLVIAEYNINCGEIQVNQRNVESENKKDEIVNQNRVKSQLNTELSLLIEERSKLDIKLKDVDDQINSKRSDNQVIAQATTEINTNLDCTVYETKIKDLNNFDYNSFCTLQVYGTSSPNSLNKIEEYNSCITTQTLENENEKLIYTDLLENCVLNNSLQKQLKQAEFEKNSNLINEIESEIYKTQTKINNLTIEGSKFIESDSSLEMSKLQANNIQDTINRTAVLLDTNVKNITDKDGNLSLTNSQKVQLEIIATKNDSQISSLLIEKGELESLINSNISKYNNINNNKGNIGKTLLGWGAGLIGSALFLEGYLDPESTGVILGAIGAATIGGGGGKLPEPVCTHTSLSFIETDPSSSTGEYKYVITNNVAKTSDNYLCTDWYTESWTFDPGGAGGEYRKGCCRANRSEYSESSGTGGFTVENIRDEGIICKGPYYVNVNGLVIDQSGAILTNETCCDEIYTNFSVIWNSVRGRCEVDRTNNTGGNNTGGNNTGGSDRCDPLETLDFDLNTGYVIDINGNNIIEDCCKELGTNFDWDGTGCFRIMDDGDTGTIKDEDCCDEIIINTLTNILNNLQSELSTIEESTQNCYDNWLNTLNENYQNFLVEEQQNYLKYLDDLKINFKLFVNNTNVDTNTNIDTDLTYLPYTQSINPIWEWDPTQQYSGIILSGSEMNVALIEDAIFNSLSTQSIDFSTEMFQPNWQTLNYTIPECVCDDLRRLYPNKEYFFSIEIENYECSLCLLVDNIRVNVTDCKTNRLITLNDCLVPQLSCVIDNKKSWVYTDQGVVTETIYPDGKCNTESTNNYNITKLTTPEERLWTNLEYRYTNYDVNHSDLIINVKNTSFSIDPAKAIECDVYDFWKKINCDECPTSCTTGETITFSGQVYTSTTLGDYTLDVSASTSGITFSCDTYTSILTDQVLELKNDYYSLTADYNESLDANYGDLLNKGGSLSKFYIQKNNCGSDTIVINNDNNLDNLFGLITENNDGTLSFYESYIYSGTTPYIGGTLTEVLSGITAQTFNQTSGMTLECCTSLNELINDKGTLGLGVGKNYVWDSTTNSCNWKDINNCKGDCEYSGTKKVFSRDYCLLQQCNCLNIEWELSGGTTGATLNTHFVGYEDGKRSWDFDISGDTHTIEYNISTNNWLIVDSSGFTEYTYSSTTECPTSELMDWIPQQKGCPNGYTLVGENCVSTTTATTVTAETITAAGTFATYSSYGARFCIPGTYTTCGSGAPASNFFNTGNSDPFWGTLAGFDGRLNEVGVWVNEPPVIEDEWIGFSNCITAATDGQYLVALAGDNGIRFSLDGTQLVENPWDTTMAAVENFRYWWVWPLDLTAGEHVINLEGYDIGGSESFGCEIIGPFSSGTFTTNTDFHIFTGTTGKDSYTANTIFSSSDEIGNTFDTQANTCPSGYTYDVCSDSCIKYEDPASTPTPFSSLTITEGICTGITSGITTVDVCVNPLDYLDFSPSQINIKDNFDDMVLSNLIDAKSRQTISDYPLLRLFYQLYLTANNCGEDLTGKLTYNNLFEFMDKIGDYWLDLLEQVVPATTIWEGCDNSGKIFRNTIFDQNKFKYKKYNLNFLCGDYCSLSGKTDLSIGSQEVYAVLENVPLYPTNVEIKDTKNDILITKVNISNTQKILNGLNGQLCSLNLQDNNTPNLQDNINSLNIQISGTNQILITQQTELSDLLIQLEQQQDEYILQQENYYAKYMSCSGLTQSLVNAQNNLPNFIPGTTNYERQRNFIASIRNELNKCIRKSNLLISKAESVTFITQIYDTNEYEGNVIILGDSDWEQDGPFYNTELIHNC